jgi:hypothetical protein
MMKMQQQPLIDSIVVTMIWMKMITDASNYGQSFIHLDTTEYCLSVCISSYETTEMVNDVMFLEVTVERRIRLLLT